MHRTDYHLASLAKWLGVSLRTKWLWVRIPLLSLKPQTWRLFRARSSLTFRQLYSVDLLWNAYVTWSEHTVIENIVNLWNCIYMLFYYTVYLVPILLTINLVPILLLSLWHFSVIQVLRMEYALIEFNLVLRWSFPFFYRTPT